IPLGRDHLAEPWVVLWTPADLHDAYHAGKPAVSSTPNIKLAFCTACPAAPFRRLSMAEVTSSIGARVPVMVETPIRTTLRWTTSRREGCSVAISMNGSVAYALRHGDRMSSTG